MDARAYRAMAEVEDRHWWFVNRRRTADWVISTLRLPQRAKILEIGAGTGGNLGMLARHGAVRAVEPDSFARQWAVIKTGFPVLEGSLPGRLPFSAREFNLVCLFDVLEHVDRDVEALRSVESLLTTDGRIFITVPAYQWLWSTHDEKLHHRRRYTRRTLTKVARTAGYEIMYLSYFNAFFLPFAISTRLFERLFGWEAYGVELPAKWLNTLLILANYLERHAMKYHGLPFGLSLLTVLKPASRRALTSSGDLQVRRSFSRQSYPSNDAFDS